MFVIVKKLKALKKPLKFLNKTKFSNIETQACNGQKELTEIQEELRANPNCKLLHVKEKECAQKVCKLNQARDEFLAQKAKCEWITKGDDNTRFFHSMIKHRRMRNKVVSITNVEGETFTESEEINQAFLKFYIDLLG